MSTVDEIRAARGGVHPGAVTKVKDYMEPRIQGFIQRAPFAVMASADAGGN